jgi:phosphoribosylanthranilate isomerase
MRRISVKICGITRLEDALLASQCGATHLGLIFAPASARVVAPHTAKLIAERLRGQVSLVGVFQNQSPELISEMHQLIGFDLVQYHGAESSETIPVTPPYIKALSGALACQSIDRYPAAEMLLLDRQKQGDRQQESLSAETWMSALSASLKNQNLSQPFLVAGGLDATNAVQTIKTFAEFPTFAGLDLASGVECAPGVKDEQKLKALFNAIREEKLYAISR